MKGSRFKATFAPIAVAAAMAIGLAGPAQAAPESKDPIKLTIHDWTGQYVTTHIMKGVLESGDLHAAMEMWETTGKEAMDASLATGKTVDLGETGMDAIEEWWYPLYMKEKCPGLPDWKALNACAEAFATPETAPKGRARL